MKKVLCIGIVLTTFLSIFAWSTTEISSANKELIRFHVIANSDAPYDQDVKLKVRDAILTNYANELATYNYDQAEAFLIKEKNNIATIADTTLKEYGYNYGAKVVYGTDTFPTKQYGSLTLPAGEYEAVKVILGEGEGKNWWCVLFPPLCFVDISNNIGVAKLEKAPVEENGEAVAANSDYTEVKMKSKLLEILE